MRLVFYHSARAWSGSARAFVAAARGLAARGHEVVFVCSPESPVETRLSYADYEVLPIGDRMPLPVVAWRLGRAMRDRSADVVFVHSPREQLASAAGSRLGVGATVIRRIAMDQPPSPTFAARAAARLAVTGLIFSSDEELRAAGALLPARLPPVAIEPGVDPDSYDVVRPAQRASLGAGPGTRLVLCVYERNGRARVATVLRTIAMLAPRHAELRLAILGAGSDDEDLRMHAAALGITGIVAFLGERDDHLAVLGAADLGWVVADGDSAAYAFLDLMSLRVPLLADHGPPARRFVADGITGLLLPPGDAPATAAAIARLLARPAQLEAMGAAGRARVAREHTEAAMLDGYETAARAAAAAPR